MVRISDTEAIHTMLGTCLVVAVTAGNAAHRRSGWVSLPAARISRSR